MTFFFLLIIMSHCTTKSALFFKTNHGLPIWHIFSEQLSKLSLILGLCLSKLKRCTAAKVFSVTVERKLPKMAQMP